MFRPDLHLHTHFSDGTSSPQELLQKLKEEAVTHFAITDHDTMAGSTALTTSGLSTNGMKVFIGVEINTSDSDEAVHILGYGGGLSSPQFNGHVMRFRQARERRAKLIVEKLGSIGIAIEWSHVSGHAKESIGRPNIADALVSLRVVANRREAFQRFLIPGKPAYVEPMGPGPEEAVRVIREAGGVAVLAHPGVASIDDKKLSSLVDLGLKGIEAYHPMHSKTQTQRFIEEAKRRALFITCGSDYHGPKSGREELCDYQLEEKDFKGFFEAIGV